jgi:hypothetical protein
VHRNATLLRETFASARGSAREVSGAVREASGA